MLVLKGCPDKMRCASSVWNGCSNSCRWGVPELARPSRTTMPSATFRESGLHICGFSTLSGGLLGSAVWYMQVMYRAYMNGPISAGSIQGACDLKRSPPNPSRFGYKEEGAGVEGRGALQGSVGGKV